MSMTVDSMVCVVSTNNLPDEFTSAHELDTFLNDKKIQLFGATRYGWMHWVMTDVCAGYGIKNLEFLGLNIGDTKLERIDEDYCPDGPYAYYYLSMLSRDRVTEAINSIDRLIDSSIGDTSIVAKVMKDQSDPEDIFAAAKESLISDTNSIEVGDEGEGARYFYTYLRTLRSILELAKGAGESVLYVQEVPA